MNRTDCGFRAPWPWFIRVLAGLRRPRRTILGSEFAGVVADVGSAVKEFSIGDEVFGDLGPYSQNVPLMLWTRFIGSKKVMMPIPRYTKDKVLRIKELIEAGAYRAVIDRTYPLDDAANATRYVETEQKSGNVVLIVGPEN